MNQAWILFQMLPQSFDIPCVDQVHCAAEDRICDPLMMRKNHCVTRLRLLDAAFQSGPACEAVFTRGSKLRIAQGQSGGEDLCIRCFRPARMKLTDTLRDCWI